MKLLFGVVVAGLLATSGVARLFVDTASESAQSPAGTVPVFELDPTWPKVPAKWKLGNVSGVAIDEQDHVWIIQRPQGEGVVPADQKSTVAPPVMEFDAAGNFLQGWVDRGMGMSGRNENTASTSITRATSGLVATTARPGTCRSADRNLMTNFSSSRRWENS